MSKQVSSTFFLLLDLFTFFELYHAENYSQSLDIIKQLKLLPFSLNAVEVKVNSFKYHDQQV